MIRKYLPYSFQVLKIDILVSIIITFLSSMVSPKGVTITGLVNWFIISFLTGGYLLGLLNFELARKKEYYFYYNMGISKLRLISMTYLFHLLIAILILIGIHYAKQI